MSTKKPKRKSRDKISKKKLDLRLPISIDKFGTADDPCFGKHNDPRCDECKRCGDAEICAIAMGQTNHLLRSEQEMKSAFKDLEELNIPQEKDKKKLTRDIKKRVRGMIKMGAGKGVLIDDVIDDIFATYSKDGFKKSRIKKVILNMAEMTNKFTLTKNQLTWKSPK